MQRSVLLISSLSFLAATIFLFELSNFGYGPLTSDNFFWNSPKKWTFIAERLILFSKNSWSKIDKLPLKSGNQTLEAFKCLKSIQNVSLKLRIIRYTQASVKEDSWKVGFICLSTITPIYCFSFKLNEVSSLFKLYSALFP